MATIRGESGSVEFETGSGSLATVVGTRSWSLSITKETLDTTVHGNTFRQFQAALSAVLAPLNWFMTLTQPAKLV